MPYPEPFIDICNPIDLLSYSSFYVETFFNETRLESATAFAYKTESKLYLISNWHVFSGRINKPDENGIYQPRVQGAIPNKIRVWIYGWETPQKYTGIGFYFDFPLCDEVESPLYISKKMRNKEYIDVSILDISDYQFKFPEEDRIFGTPFCANTIIDPKFCSEYILHASDDVYIIGFPFGKIDSQYTPIWKKGSIASDLRNSGNKFFIDTASRDGMSGSPIYRIVSDNISKLKTKEKIINNEILYRVEFIGIYSGRIIESPESLKDDSCSYVNIPKYNLSAAAQLGIAWKKEVIESILN